MAVLRDVIYDGERDILPQDVYNAYLRIYNKPPSPMPDQLDAIVKALLNTEVNPETIHDAYVITNMVYRIVEANPPVVMKSAEPTLVPISDIFPDQFLLELVQQAGDRKCLRMESDGFISQRPDPAVVQSEFERLRFGLQVVPSITLEQASLLVADSAVFRCVQVARPPPPPPPTPEPVAEEEQFAVDPALQQQMSDEAQEAQDIADTAQDIAITAAEEAAFAQEQADIAAQSDDEQAAADAAKAAEIAAIAAEAAAKAAEEARAAADAGDVQAAQDAIDVAQQAADIVTEAAATTEKIVTGGPIDTGVVAAEGQDSGEPDYVTGRLTPPPAKKTVEKSTKADGAAKGGIPTWAIVAGGAAVLAAVAFGGGKKKRS